MSEELRIGMLGFTPLEEAGLRWYLRREPRIRFVTAGESSLLLVRSGFEGKEMVGCNSILLSPETVTPEELEQRLSPYLDIGGDGENEPLSQREKEVLRLLGAGLSNKEVADRLCISLNTAITHRRNITVKLGIKSLAGLSLYAYLHDML